jgi:hypothetical protein
MAKTRGFLADFFARLGGSVFALLSGLEEKGIFPKASRWTKTFLLGFLVALVGALSLKANDDIILCYVPIPDPAVNVTEIQITPNPTKGADSVKVTATARIPSYDIGSSYIMGASLNLMSDTVLYPMRALDGRFGDTLECIEGTLFVGGLEPETTWIELSLNTSQRRFHYETLMLVISEPDSSEAEEK